MVQNQMTSFPPCRPGAPARTAASSFGHGGRGVLFYDMTEIEIIAVHESAHFVVSSALGHNSCPVIFDEPQPQANGRTVAGQCLFDPIARPSAFEAAAVAWAGIIAEGLLGISYTLEMPFPLNKSTMRDWYRVVMSNFERLSLGDQTLIAGYRDTWRTFKSSFRIVTKHKRKIERLARLMVDNKTKGQEMTSNIGSSAQTPDALAYRATILERYLAGLPINDPDRPRYGAILACYRRGEWPPASVFEPGAPTDPAKAT